jgi:DNA-binding HxlR family transcriptional regulator
VKLEVIADISPKNVVTWELSIRENKIITRTLYDDMPVTVEYSLTELGLSLNRIVELLTWNIHFVETLSASSCQLLFYPVLS